MKNWKRFKENSKVTKMALKAGVRFVEGPFSPPGPAAISKGRRGWFLGDGIAGGFARRRRK